jgi:hypothetical protein
MTVDLSAATDFMTTHARTLDRRRFELMLGDASSEHVLAAADAYRNADGGYGWGMEPDLRDVRSQPGGALHAFEVFEEVAPATTGRADELCDWLASVSLDDGGLPFALPVARRAGCAPFWAEADPIQSSLHITAAVTAAAHRVACHDPAVAGHPWLERATRFCLAAIGKVDEGGHALELMFALQFLDAVHDTEPDAPAQLARLGAWLPGSGALHVGGGQDDEFVRALDFAPMPDRPIRALFSAEVVAEELDRLANGQEPDGGWRVDFTSYSPAAELEWRGYMTTRAVTILTRNGARPRRG